jgi:hypothetical protein
MPLSSAMNVDMGGIAPPNGPAPNQSPPNRMEPPSKDGVSGNLGIWIFGIFFSMLSLLALPLYRFFTQACYTGWFIDIFSNTGIIMISATMSLAALFELFISKRRFNIPSGLLVLLVFFCCMEHGIVTVAYSEPAQSIIKLAVFNMFIFCSMFVLGLFSFGFLSGNSGKRRS